MLRLLIALLALSTALAQDDLRGAFEKARMLEERNTNLPEAIRLYADVAERGKGQRTLAARARFQQGVLLNRLNRRPEALNAWRAVIAEFPEQAELVRLSRVRLNPAGVLQREIVQRRISEGDEYSRPSPDGRSLVFTDWSTGNLTIRNLATGEQRPLTKKREPWSKSNAQARGAVYSPDGKRIAYQWSDGFMQVELRVISVDGSGDRLIHGDPDLWECEPLAWSPDGARVLFRTFGKDRALWLAAVPASGGEARRVTRSPQNGWLGPAVFDRDSAAVITTVHTVAGADIVRIDPSGAQTSLVDHPAFDFVIGWTPGGRLLFGSDRLGPTGIWSLRVENGAALGEPILVKQDVGVRSPLGVTRAGALFYTLSTGVMDVYTAVLDLAGGTVTAAPRPPRHQFAGSGAYPSWSPDGTKLLFYSRRTPRAGKAVIIDMARNRAREVTGDVNVTFRPQWDPDGVSIFGPGTDSQGRRGHFRVNPETGQSKLVFPIEQTDSQFEGAWSPDGRYFFNRPTDWRKGIYRLDARTGEKTFLYVPPQGVSIGKENLTPSPDGRLLAFHAVGPQSGVSSLMIMPADGGEAKPLFSVKDPVQFAFGAFAWTPDSRTILASFGPEGKHEVWKIPMDGGAPSSTGLKMPLIASLRLNRDEKTVTFHSGDQNSEIWVLENFLPPEGRN